MAAEGSERQRPHSNAPADMRWQAPLIALASPALFLLVDSAVAWSRGWVSEGRFDAAIVIAAASWLLLLGLLVALPLGRRLLNRYRLQTLALVISGGLAWLVGEAAVTALIPSPTDLAHHERPGFQRINRPVPGMMRGVGAEARTSYNSKGVRGSDPPPRQQAYRVMCVGGSSTACTYLDDSKTWPQLLATDLHRQDPEHNYWVGNVGKPGLRIPEHLRFVQESPLLAEVDCVVLQAGINDFMSCLMGVRPEPLWRRSRIIGLLRTITAHFTTSNMLVEDQAGAVYGRRRAARQAAQINETLPPIEGCLETFSSQLEELIANCHKRKIKLICTTQPVLWRADLDAENLDLLWFGQLPDGRYLSAAALRSGMDRYNDVLRRVCAKHQIPLVDLSELNGDVSVFYDDCHYTEHGAERVAQLVAAGFAAERAQAKDAAPAEAVTP